MEKHQDESYSDKGGADGGRCQQEQDSNVYQSPWNIKSLYHNQKFLDPALIKTRSCSPKNLDTWKHSKKRIDSEHAEPILVALLLANAYFGF